MERSTWPKNLSSSRKHAIKELLHGQNPTKKLRHLFDAHSQVGNNTRPPSFADDLIVNILRSSSNTLSESMSAESDEVLQVPNDACVLSEDSDGESISTPVPRTITSTELSAWPENSQSASSDYYAVFKSAGEISALSSDQGDVMSSSHSLILESDFDDLLDIVEC